MRYSWPPGRVSAQCDRAGGRVFLRQLSARSCSIVSGQRDTGRMDLRPGTGMDRLGTGQAPGGRRQAVAALATPAGGIEAVVRRGVPHNAVVQAQRIKAREQAVAAPQAVEAINAFQWVQGAADQGTCRKDCWPWNASRPPRNSSEVLAVRLKSVTLAVIYAVRGRWLAAVLSFAWHAAQPLALHRSAVQGDTAGVLVRHHARRPREVEGPSPRRRAATD